MKRTSSNLRNGRKIKGLSFYSRKLLTDLFVTFAEADAEIQQKALQTISDYIETYDTENSKRVMVTIKNYLEQLQKQEAAK